MGVISPQNIVLFRMDYHKNELAKACRVCGKRLKKAKGRDRRFSASEYSSELFEVFKIDTSSDTQHIHPPSFCLSCRVFMGSWHSRGGSTPAVGRVFTWEKHHEGDCKVSGITYLKYWAQTHNMLGLSALPFPPMWMGSFSGSRKA